MASSQLDMEEMYARLVSEEDDEGGVLIGEDDVVHNRQIFVLVGRFITERNINFLAMQNMMTSLWRSREGVGIHDLGNSRYSFVIFHTLDMQKVVEGGPWSFEQSSLVCHQLGREENANNVRLNKKDIWVHVYDLPSGILSDKILQCIDNHVVCL